MHLIESLKTEFCFDLFMFSKYPATSINCYFYKMTLLLYFVRKIVGHTAKVHKYTLYYFLTNIFLKFKYYQLCYCELSRFSIGGGII